MHRYQNTLKISMVYTFLKQPLSAVTDKNDPTAQRVAATAT